MRRNYHKQSPTTMQFTINSDDDISEEEISESEDEYAKRKAPKPQISFQFDDGNVRISALHCASGADLNSPTFCAIMCAVNKT